MATLVLERALESRLGEHLAALGVSGPYLDADGHLASPPQEGWVRVRRHTPTVPVRVILDPTNQPTPEEAAARETTDSGTAIDCGTATEPAEAPEPAATGQAGEPGVGVVGRLRGVLGELGVPADVATVLTNVAVACASVADPEATRPAGHTDHHDGHTDHHDDEDDTSDDERPDAESRVPDLHGGPGAWARGRVLLDAVATLLAATSTLEGVALAGTGQLTRAVGKVLLADKGVTDPAELSATATDRWRAAAKSRTRHELAAATGWGPGAAADLVSLANTPATITGPIDRAMAAGEAGWTLVRRYHRACADLDHTDAAAIGAGLFSADPDTAVTERLTPEGEFTGGPWHHQEFHRALDRETTKVKSRDREQADKARHRARANADVRVRLDKEGTAAITIGATPTQGAAVADRIERAARAARAAGDPHTLRQLRCAAALSLLLHGTLPAEDLPEDPDLITVDQSTRLTTILHALPTAQLNVIVPLTTLLGTTDGAPLPPTTPTTADGTPIPAAFLQPPDTTAPPRTSGSPGAPGCTCVCTCTGQATGGGGTDADGEVTSSDDAPASDSTTASGSVDGGDSESSAGGSDTDSATGDAGDVGVGEVIGRHSLFLTGTDARVLALTPGSTMYRLVTDPVTGALIERSTTAYRFDKAMRAHIIAADVFCRAPGCLRPASLAQIDHVQEHGTPGGHTCTGNGQPLDPTHHDLKTKKAWDAVIAANRAVTWTTLLGRIYTTKAHDYRQYTKLLAAATDTIEQAIASGQTPADAIDDAIYQALTYRPPGTPHRADDDNPRGGEDPYTAWDQLDLTHTPPTGRRVHRPHPATRHTEQQRHHTTRHHDTTRTDTGTTDHGPNTPWTDHPHGPPPF